MTYVLCANFDDILGEGTTVEAYSNDLDKLVEYAIKDATKDGTYKRENLRLFESEYEGIWELKDYFSGDREDPDSYDVFMVITTDEEAEIYPPSINLDELL